jgi:hypothetical protein
MIGSFKSVLSSVKTIFINYPINEPCGHEVMGSEMQGKAAYIRPKVVGSCANGSYTHRAALLNEDLSSAHFSNPYTAGS